jgi:hypothetical protein
MVKIHEPVELPIPVYFVAGFNIIIILLWIAAATIGTFRRN